VSSQIESNREIALAFVFACGASEGNRIERSPSPNSAAARRRRRKSFSPTSTAWPHPPIPFDRPRVPCRASGWRRQAGLFTRARLPRRPPSRSGSRFDALLRLFVFPPSVSSPNLPPLVARFSPFVSSRLDFLSSKLAPHLHFDDHFTPPPCFSLCRVVIRKRSRPT
jgi:hypothetical protein